MWKNRFVSVIIVSCIFAVVSFYAYISSSVKNPNEIYTYFYIVAIIIASLKLIAANILGFFTYLGNQKWPFMAINFLLLATSAWFNYASLVDLTIDSYPKLSTLFLLLSEIFFLFSVFLNEKLNQKKLLFWNLALLSLVYFCLQQKLFVFDSRLNFISLRVFGFSILALQFLSYMNTIRDFIKEFGQNLK